jgi:hypothetical protein
VNLLEPAINLDKDAAAADNEDFPDTWALTKLAFVEMKAKRTLCCLTLRCCWELAVNLAAVAPWRDY